jgi:hypothetical protein
VLFSESMSSYHERDPFTGLAATLTAGETISFIVDTGSGSCTYCDLSTGLRATISRQTDIGDSSSLYFAQQTMPESSTWAMMLIGFAGLGLATLMRGGRNSVLTSLDRLKEAETAI